MTTFQGIPSPITWSDLTGRRRKRRPDVGIYRCIHCGREAALTGRYCDLPACRAAHDQAKDKQQAARSAKREREAQARDKADAIELARRIAAAIKGGRMCPICGRPVVGRSYRGTCSVSCVEVLRHRIGGDLDAPTGKEAPQRATTPVAAGRGKGDRA